MLINILSVVIERKHPYARKVQQYGDILNIGSLNELRNISEGELSGKINAWMLKEWEDELSQKSTLAIYREYKNEIKTENFYDNTFQSVLLFRARANCLKLGWRKRFEQGEVDCKLCGYEEETLEHFIMDCPRYSEIRNDYDVSGMNIQSILGFDGGKNIEKSKRFIEKIWNIRKASCPHR